MLILMRKEQERFWIGDHIQVSIIDIQNDEVRVGINAPKIIPVFRDEIYIRLKHQKYLGRMKANEERYAPSK